MTRRICIAGLLVALASGCQRQDEAVPLPGAHARGRLVRFWATPDGPSPAREALWRELRTEGVDLLNTDDLKGLQEFLLRHGR